MEHTWTVSGVCGHWQCTVAMTPLDDGKFTPDTNEVTSALETLQQHFLTLVNLLETKTLWELEGSQNRW
ncbi:hypothetical protein ACFQV2_38560 [Actinokineospora soli]|uniref:Uncharacterized protein n=1 Tax=Actinokineospora soli TaxID=1048753 RepID=A0ABW2U036_9PSEU